jgi:hypothetical protein
MLCVFAMIQRFKLHCLLTSMNGMAMQATAMGTGNLNALEGPDSAWYAAMMERDIERVDTFLGLLIAMMADAEAKELVCLKMMVILMHICQQFHAW